MNDVELPKYTQPTILIVYSHGSESESFKNKTEAFFGDFQSLPLCLRNGLVYSNACSVGSIFGQKISLHDSSFFGYNQVVSIDKNYVQDFVECDVHGLYHILKGKTLTEARNEAVKKFTDTIDKLPMFAASYLLQARDSIAIHGKTNLQFFE